MSKGQWAKTARAHKMSIYHFSISQKMRLQFINQNHYSCLALEVCCIREFEIFWRVWKKGKRCREQSKEFFFWLLKIHDYKINSLFSLFPLIQLGKLIKHIIPVYPFLTPNPLSLFVTLDRGEFTKHHKRQRLVLEPGQFIKCIYP